MTIKQLPDCERPRERLQRLGEEALSTTELLAIILGSGTKGVSVLQLAENILKYFGTLKKLSVSTVEELLQIKGLGKAKAIQLKAALTFGVRATHPGYQSKCKILTPEHAYHYVKDELVRESREILQLLLLDVKGYLIAKKTVSIGTLSQTLIHPREVFFEAIRHKAASMIIAHNHPSGDPTPSKEDLELTESLINAGRLMGIPVQDHIIIGARTFVSLREVGVILF